MIFLGTTFCSGKYTLYPPAVKLSEITAIQIFDGTYNHLYLSADPTDTVNNFYDSWDYDTKLNASFDENLEAGNSGFSLNTTEYLVVKRREVGTTKWVTIYAKKVETRDDLNVDMRDTYGRAGVEYEYCVSSYADGVENSYVIRNVFSDFDGYYVTDKDEIYGTIYDVDGCNTSRNMASQVLQLLNSKYMTVVSNSSTNCDSGSLTGTFFKLGDDNITIDTEQSNQHRRLFINKLSNNKPLILKIKDGRIWMIKVINMPTNQQMQHPDLRQITFEWVEIGDVNDMRSLYYSGLSDVDARWW